MLIGYARVSTADQHLDLQTDALTAAGCGKTFTDTASGAKAERPGLRAALDFARSGDALAVWRLDRLGRSLPDLIARVAELDARGVGFRSLHENIDTTTATGRLIFHVFAALAEFERSLLRERTMAGLEAARARGRKGGGVAKLTPVQIDLARRMLADRKTPVQDVADAFGVHRSTLYRAGVIV